MHYAPFTVTWFITKRCNLRCTHCFNYDAGESPARTDSELDINACKRVVDDLADAGVFSISFGGGEPLSLKWFPELVEYCGERGISTIASSNGALLTDKIAGRLCSAGMRKLQLSLDGATQQRHDSIRGHGNFRAVLRATDICHATGITPHYAFTLMRNNVHELAAVLELSLMRAVHRLKLQLYIPVGRAHEPPVSPDTRLQAFKICRQFERDHGEFTVDYPCYTGHDSDNPLSHWDTEKNPLNLSCGAGTTRAVIFEDGSVGGCEFMRHESEGNLDSSGFMSIWNSGANALEKWRRLDKITGQCGSCGYRGDCGYGCRAYAYHVGGDFYGSDTSCLSVPPAGRELAQDSPATPSFPVRDSADSEYPKARLHLPVLEIGE